MGVFGYGEIISNLSQPEEHREVFTAKVTGLFPTKEDFKRMVAGRAARHGAGLGAGHPARRRRAAGVVRRLHAGKEDQAAARRSRRSARATSAASPAPESANNAGAQTSFIPLLTLGIPPNAVMALMVGAMTIHNIQPGPQVMTSNPQLFWGLIASMWMGNAMLVILNLPLIGMWIKLLTVPYRWLFPAIVLFCAIGVYSTNNNTFDVWMVGVFGLIGYVFIKLGCEPAPLLLGFILGPMMEENLRRALLLSRGDWSVLVTRPLSAGLLCRGPAGGDRGAALDQGQARGSVRRGVTHRSRPRKKKLSGAGYRCRVHPASGRMQAGRTAPGLRRTPGRQRGAHFIERAVATLAQVTHLHFQLGGRRASGALLPLGLVQPLLGVAQFPEESPPARELRFHRQHETPSARLKPRTCCPGYAASDGFP